MLDRRKFPGNIGGHNKPVSCCSLGGYTRSKLFSSLRFLEGLVNDQSLLNSTCSGKPRYLHGGNTGTNPVGDANSNEQLRPKLQFPAVAEILRGSPQKLCPCARPGCSPSALVRVTTQDGVCPGCLSHHQVVQLRKPQPKLGAAYLLDVSAIPEL
jgi:hypothetical protein